MGGSHHKNGRGKVPRKDS